MLPLVALNVPADADLGGLKGLLESGHEQGWWEFAGRLGNLPPLHQDESRGAGRSPLRQMGCRRYGLLGS